MSEEKEYCVVTHELKNGSVKRYQGGMYLANAINEADRLLRKGERWVTIYKSNVDHSELQAAMVQPPNTD